jgi:hypothetical protein
MSFNFTTAQSLVDIKIQRNNALIELLDTESKILKKGMVINYRWVEHNKEKVDLIKKINDIETQQLQIYCPVRQDAVKDLTEQVNVIDVDIKNTHEEIKKLQIKCQELLVQIRELNSQIPNQTIVTNYRVPLKNDNCHESDLNS